jgi:hypothetical protein
MPFVPNDPAESRRIVRQSLLSTVGRLYCNDPKTPEEAIAIARTWEAYVYEDAPPLQQFTANGSPVMVAPASTLVCAECGNPLTPVAFKTGNTWPVEQLASQGQTKYGRVLCKQHYFGKKPA